MISIIIPAYNASRFLTPTLQSIVAQSFPDWELLVVDDGSTDDTCDIVTLWAKGDARVKLLRQVNSGPSAARNRGAAAADSRSDSLIFLDADDLWEPDALAILQRGLTPVPGDVAAYGLARYIDANGTLVDEGVLEAHQRNRKEVVNGKAVALPPDAPTTFAVEALTEVVITSGTMLIRKAAFIATGGWAEDLRLWEDWDLWLRLTKLGGMAFIDQPVLRYRRHDANLSGDAAKLDAGERAVRERLIAALSADQARRQVAIDGARLHHEALVSERWAWCRRAAASGDLVGAIKQGRHALRLKAMGPVR